MTWAHMGPYGPLLRGGVQPGPVWRGEILWKNTLVSVMHIYVKICFFVKYYVFLFFFIDSRQFWEVP